MDFSRLQTLQENLNSTTSPASALPSTLLELVVPGYSTISQLAFRLLGIDIGVIVTGWALVFGCYTGWRYLYDFIQGYFDEYYTSSIQIDDDDSFYHSVKAWLVEQKTIKPSRKLKAVTNYKSKNKNDDNIHEEDGIYKYEEPKPRYELTNGVHNEFYFENRYFKVVRSNEKDDHGRELKESLEICCYGQSTEPIKNLLSNVRKWKIKQEDSMTTVHRAFQGRDYWSRQCCRPSRSLQTVSLDQHQKDSIVEDINEYLHPATARWYAARGIPHRRGYLFHGPPGTGKSSLSFALAGVFGLDIYCLSLNDKGLTENELCSLFDDLPDRCIVLLEDIDSAGLKRAEEVEKKEESSSTTTDPSKDDAAKAAAEKSETSPSGSLSLSALLNVIDGAASHEGHVLIMTTNTPEKLDPALIRPGRVDLQVAFTFATRDQIHEIYMRMYSATSEEQASQKRMSNFKPVKITDPEKLQSMARRFADRIPADRFSPAEIQGYLLMRKRAPQKALDDLDKWTAEMVEAKRKGKKLVGAQ